MNTEPVQVGSAAWRRVARVLGSIQAAVVILAAVAVSCTAALLVEGSHGTEFVQAAVYRSTWFALLALALAVNVGASVVARYPWHRRLTGFVITHAGLILLLAGSLVTRWWGLEGQVVLAEGDGTDALEIEGEELALRFADGTTTAVSADVLRRWVGAAPRPLPGSAWRIGVDEWLPASQLVEAWEIDPTGRGPAVVHCTVPDGVRGTVDVWLRPRDRDGRVRPLGALTIETQPLADAAAIERFLAPVPATPPADAGTAVVRRSDGQTTRVPVGEWLGRPHDLGTGATVTITRVLRNAAVRQTEDRRWVVTETLLGGAGPALEASIRWPGGEERHAAFARHPDMASLRGGHDSAGGSHHQVVYERDGRVDGAVVTIGLTADGRVLARSLEPGQAGERRARPVPPGTALSASGVRLVAVLPSARRADALAAAAPDAMGRTPPGLRLRFEGPTGTGSGWIRFGEPRRLPLPGGHVDGVWRRATRPLGFQLELLDFRKLQYPGSAMAAGYESDVRITDAARGRTETVTVAMNQPLRHGAVWGLPGTGWAFYQSSYVQPPGGREISIFSAANDPGYPVVLLGSALLVAGIFIQIALTRTGRGRRRPRAVAPA